ncbi:MAG: hypothetical protein D4R56_03635 [Deltaproteobacteria bacterium]|nr:MAG: hypothetical protein D4R56_03635 [Deltaproteobacteria bacterium]
MRRHRGAHQRSTDHSGEDPGSPEKEDWVISVHSCSAKAVCAASNRRPIGSRGAQGQTLEDVQVLYLTLAAGPKNWTAINGGWPIMVETGCLGGIGVSGGTRKQDAEIAEAALGALGAVNTK